MVPMGTCGQFSRLPACIFSEGYLLFIPAWGHQNRAMGRWLGKLLPTEGAGTEVVLSRAEAASTAAGYQCQLSLRGWRA